MKKTIFYFWTLFLLMPLAKAEQLEWYTFRVNQMGYRYFDQTSVSGGIFWAPGLKVYEKWGVRTQLGVNWIKAHSESLNLFSALEAQGFLTYTFWSHFILEVGGGWQYWKIIDGGIHSLYTAQGHYLFSEPIFGVLQTIFIGFTGVKDYEIHSQYRLGLQIGF